MQYSQKNKLKPIGMKAQLIISITLSLLLFPGRPEGLDIMITENIPTILPKSFAAIYY